MNIIIITPKIKIVYDGCSSLLAYNIEGGMFEILSNHENFISVLAPSDIVIKKRCKPVYSLLVLPKGILQYNNTSDLCTIAGLYLDVKE